MAFSKYLTNVGLHHAKSNIAKHINDVLPKISICFFPNKKLQMGPMFCAKLKARTTAFNLKAYKASQFYLNP